MPKLPKGYLWEVKTIRTSHVESTIINETLVTLGFKNILEGHLTFFRLNWLKARVVCCPGLLSHDQMVKGLT